MILNSIETSWPQQRSRWKPNACPVYSRKEQPFFFFLSRLIPFTVNHCQGTKEIGNRENESEDRTPLSVFPDCFESYWGCLPVMGYKEASWKNSPAETGFLMPVSLGLWKALSGFQAYR